MKPPPNHKENLKKELFINGVLLRFRCLCCLLGGVCCYYVDVVCVDVYVDVCGVMSFVSLVSLCHCVVLCVTYIFATPPNDVNKNERTTPPLRKLFVGCVFRLQTYSNI